MKAAYEPLALAKARRPKPAPPLWTAEVFDDRMLALEQARQPLRAVCRPACESMPHGMWSG
jgi:hypothetical protein